MSLKQWADNRSSESVPSPHPVTDADFEAVRHTWAPIRSRGELPHLHIEGGIYFVTFRLFDAVSLNQAARMTAPQEPDDIAESSEPPLRAGSCALGRPEAARIVAGALRHFDAQRYTLHAWCVMPNHVHVVVVPWAGHTLSDVLHSWKSFTATAINRLLGRAGPFWERESFDHLIRNLRSFEKFVDYTVNNPVVAGFCASPEQWEFSSACGAGFQPASPKKQSAPPHSGSQDGCTTDP
jgi:REP element-mobilizing transposase RayT